jgi:PBP1b-binding outer membrane lipoprotein LpoB
MNRIAIFLFMLMLAGCTDAKPTPTQAVNEMIESPLQNTVISSFDTYPPKPVADAGRHSITSMSSPSECAGDALAESARAPADSTSRHGSLGAVP